MNNWRQHFAVGQLKLLQLTLHPTGVFRSSEKPPYLVCHAGHYVHRMLSHRDGSHRRHQSKNNPGNGWVRTVISTVLPRSSLRGAHKRRLEPIPIR